MNKGKVSELISASVEERLRLYLPLLRLWKFKNKRELSTELISEFLNLPEELITADFSMCSVFNKTHPQHLNADDLIDCIEQLLGQKEFNECLLIGAGRLGTSLLQNESILVSGLKIVAAFDSDPQKLGSIISGIKVQNIEKLEATVRQMHLKMALIATTPENAIQAAENAIRTGINVIWNFTVTQIPEPKGVIIQNTKDASYLKRDYKKILSRL